MQEKVLWNTSENPFDPDLAKMITIKGREQPAWIKKRFFSDYPCIQKIIINIFWINYKKTNFNDNFRIVPIGGGFIIDLKEMMQKKVNDFSKQRQIYFVFEKDFKRPTGSTRTDEAPFALKSDIKNNVQLIDH